jgi:plastocyanin
MFRPCLSVAPRAALLTLALLAMAPPFAARPLQAGEAVAATTPQVTIDNFTFSPGRLTVKAGTTVTFANRDDIPHTVVASGGTFRSSALDTGDSYTFTFAAPGVFAYYCSLHPHMQGTIVVEP